MRKAMISWEGTNIKSKSTSNIYPKSPKHLKLPVSLTSKIKSIKSKISEILMQKEKVMKNIESISKRFKQSQKKEQSLEILSKSIGTRIKNLEKRKKLLKIWKKERESERVDAAKLKSFLLRFRDLAYEERKIEEDEQDIYLKDTDLSFGSRSSDSTQAGSLAKESMQISMLKSTITKIGEKEVSLSRHSNLAKYKKEAIFSLREKFQEEKKDFDLELKNFEKFKRDHQVFKDKVLGQKRFIEKLKSRNAKLFNELELVLVKNDAMIMEINDSRKKFTRNCKQDLMKIKMDLEEKEETVEILKDSVHYREFKVNELREKVVHLRELASLKVNCVEKKCELNQILKELDLESKAESPRCNLESRKKRLKDLAQLALKKDKELREIEKMLNN